MTDRGLACHAARRGLATQLVLLHGLTLTEKLRALENVDDARAALRSRAGAWQIEGRACASEMPRGANSGLPRLPWRMLAHLSHPSTVEPLGEALVKGDPLLENGVPQQLLARHDLERADLLAALGAVRDRH